MSFFQYQAAGNLGGDPELRYTPNGVPVCNLTVAVDQSYTDRDGKKQEKTKWLRVVTWRDLAKNCAEYLRKGDRVTILGQDFNVSGFEDKEGKPAGSVDFIAYRVVFPSRGSSANGASGGNYGSQPSYQPRDMTQFAEEEIPF